MVSQGSLKVRREGTSFAGMLDLTFTLKGKGENRHLLVSAAPSALALQVDSTINRRRVVIARVDESTIHIYPININPGKSDFMDPKYGPLREIVLTSSWLSFDTVNDLESFSELLSELPTGFNRIGDLGLGFLYEYRSIPEQISEIEGVKCLVMPRGNRIHLHGDTYTLGIKAFDRMRKELDKITARGRREMQSQRARHAHNALLSSVQPTRFPAKPEVLPPGILRRAIETESQVAALPRTDQRALISAATSSLDAVAQDAMPAVVQLGQTAQRVALEHLIAKFEHFLNSKHNESVWQRFFSTNAFVLGLAFAYPAVVIAEQAHVGNRNIKGGGQSILDFMMANECSGSVAVVEIKTPDIKLLEAKHYRGNLKGPSRELTAAVAQVLQQRFHLVSNFSHIQGEELEDKDVASVHCILVAGSKVDSREDRRSFELFRGALKDVSIVTFDELLTKLRTVAEVLKKAETAETAKAGE